MFATNRKGFAMILAIFVVVLIALGGTLLLSNAAIGSKSISNGYLRSQAELLAQSATEYALMRAQGIDTSGGSCLNQLNITVYNSNGAVAGNEMFDISVSLVYSFRGAHAAGCAWVAENTGNDTTVLIDATVRDHNLSTESIQVHKRSWEKL